MFVSKNFEIPKLNDEKRWYRCPYCEKKMFTFLDTAYVRDIQIKCKGCDSVVDIQILVKK